MKKTIQILFQSIIIALIPLLFLWACQTRSGVEPEKYNISEITKTDTVKLTNEDKFQLPKPYRQEDKIVNTIHNSPSKIINTKAIHTPKITYCIPEPISYPGGEQELLVFLELNNSYKRHKYYESIDGNVYLKLIVDSTGKVISSNILRGVGLGIDEEAIRLAGLLKFLPATDSTCNTISSDYILKVNFKKPYYPTVNIDGVYTEEITNSNNTKKDLWHIRKNAQPHYPGGKLKMSSYFKKNLAYSFDKISEGKEGKVKLGLEINENGKLSDITVYESDGEGFTEEAKRLVQSVEYWHPAIINHRHASGYMKVIIKFKIPRNLKIHIKSNEN